MRLVAHLQRLHFAFHDQAQTGQLMAYANTDIQQINNTCCSIPLTDRELDPDGRGRVILVFAEPGLALFALGALPLLNISATRFNHRMYPGRHGAAGGAVGSLGRRRGERDRHPGREGLRGRAAAARAAVGRGRQRLRPLDGPGAPARQLHAAHSTSCRRSVSSASSGTAGTRCSTGNLTVGDIVAANLYVLMLIWPLRMIGMLLGQLPRSAAAAGRIDDVLATDPAIEDVPHAASLPDGPGRRCASSRCHVRLRTRSGACSTAST